MKRTTKRLFSIFLVVMMMFSFVPTMAWAEGEQYYIYSPSHGDNPQEVDIGTVRGMIAAQAGESIDFGIRNFNTNGILTPSSGISWTLFDVANELDISSELEGTRWTASEDGEYEISAVWDGYEADARIIVGDYTVAYTRYEEPRYIVTFDTNAIDGMNVVLGSSVNDKSVQPGYNLVMAEDKLAVFGDTIGREYKEGYQISAEGYTWEGWYENEALNGSPVWELEINEDTTLYAKWDGIPAVLVEALQGMTVELTGEGLGPNGMAIYPDYTRVANITMPQGFSADWINQYDEMAEGMTVLEKLYSMPTQAVLNISDTIDATEYVLNLKGSDLMALADKGMDLVVKTEFGTVTIGPDALKILGAQATKGDKANAGEGITSGYDPDVQIVFSKDNDGNTKVDVKKRSKATAPFLNVSQTVVPYTLDKDEVNVDESVGISYDVPVTMDGEELANMSAMVQMALQEEQSVVYEAVDKFVPNKDVYAVGEGEPDMKDRYPNLEDMPTVPPGA